MAQQYAIEHLTSFYFAMHYLILGQCAIIPIDISYLLYARPKRNHRVSKLGLRLGEIENICLLFWHMYDLNWYFDCMLTAVGDKIRKIFDVSTQLSLYLAGSHSLITLCELISFLSVGHTKFAPDCVVTSMYITTLLEQHGYHYIVIKTTQFYKLFIISQRNISWQCPIIKQRLTNWDCGINMR